MEMMNKWSRWCKNRALGLLLIRAAIGMVFFAHGWMKMQNMDMAEAMFIGFGFPAWVAVAIAWLEVIGGIALVLGVMTRLFAKLFVIVMIVAFFVTGGISTGYFAHEMELVLFLGSLGILFAGSGRYSLWACECHNCGAMNCKDGNCQAK